MNVIIATLIVSWVFGSVIFRLFSGKQGHTQHDIYKLKKYKITPDRSNDDEETVSFDKSSAMYQENTE